MKKRSLYLCVIFIFNISISIANDDLFAVTPENCGKMSLEQCKKVMAAAKAHMAKTEAETQASQQRIDDIHEEALKMLSDAEKSKKTQ